MNEIILYVLIDNQGRILYSSSYKDGLEFHKDRYPETKVIELKGEY